MSGGGSGGQAAPSESCPAANQQATSRDIEVALVSDDGHPIWEASFNITFKDGSRRGGRTDEDGVRRLHGVPENTVFALVWTNEADVRAKTLAARLKQGIDGKDYAIVSGVLMNDPRELGDVMRVYRKRYEEEAPAALIAAFAAHDCRPLLENLLARANLMTGPVLVRRDGWDGR